MISIARVLETVLASCIVGLLGWWAHDPSEASRVMDHLVLAIGDVPQAWTVAAFVVSATVPLTWLMLLLASLLGGSMGHLGQFSPLVEGLLFRLLGCSFCIGLGLQWSHAGHRISILMLIIAAWIIMTIIRRCRAYILYSFEVH